MRSLATAGVATVWKQGLQDPCLEAFGLAQVLCLQALFLLEAGSPGVKLGGRTTDGRPTVLSRAQNPRRSRRRVKRFHSSALRVPELVA